MNVWPPFRFAGIRVLEISDDFSRALGDPAENQLEVALGYIATGSCTAPVGARPRVLQAAKPAAPVLVRSPFRENRIYRP